VPPERGGVRGDQPQERNYIVKQGLSLTQFAQTIQERDAAKADYLAPVPLIDVSTNGHTSLVLRDVEDASGNELAPLHIGNTAHSQLASYLGVPKAFYDHVQRNAQTIRDPNDPERALYDTLINGLLRSCPPDDARLVRTLNGTARAWLSDRYRQMDNLEILTRLLPVIQQLPAVNWDQSSLQVTEDRMYLQLVDTSKPKVIKSGHNRMDDVLQRGVVITNSEVGLGSFAVQPLVFRQVCSNGLVITEYAQRRFHVGGRNSGDAGIVWQSDTQKARNETTILEMRDLMKTAMSDEFLNKIAARAQDAADLPIKGAQLEPVVKNVTERFRLNGDERDAMFNHLVEGGDLSLWGLVNSITRAAQDVESYDRSVELQAIGGNILALPKHDVTALLSEVSPN
jgi:uncharacterized protein DUF932